MAPKWTGISWLSPVNSEKQFLLSRRVNKHTTCLRNASHNHVAQRTAPQLPHSGTKFMTKKIHALLWPGLLDHENIIRPYVEEKVNVSSDQYQQSLYHIM